MTIDQLLRLQRAFDESRGIASLPNDNGAGEGDRLSRLEYSLIGLTGEVGEIANVIKKARRDRARGEALPDGIPAGLSDEVADAFSYLLKLSDNARIDPGRAYLLKMCRNAHRFSPSRAAPPALAVCGPPGSGKSTVVRELASMFGRDRTYLECAERNPHLDRIDRPMRDGDAARSQEWFLNAVAEFIRTIDARPVLLDQDPTAIALVYGQLLFERGELSSRVFEHHLAALLTLEIEQVERLGGRVVVLLDAPAGTLAERCRHGNGPDLDTNFLQMVRDRFARVFTGLPNVLTVNAERSLNAVLQDARAVASRLIDRPPKE